MKRILAAAALASALAASTASAQEVVTQDRRAPVSPLAQTSPVPPQAPVVLYPGSQSSAREVQQQLREVLRQYPPSLPDIFRLDPSLLSRPDYLGPYPALAGFLQQHPEIIRNPQFFFGQQWFEEPRLEGERTRERTLNMIDGALTGFTVLTGFLVAISLVFALLKQTLDYRRWRRQMQLQTDVHTKLLDRLTNNQELLAYIESSAGRRFLESAPVPAAAPMAPMTIAPVARILWSVQIGIVLAALGLGFWTARAAVDDVEAIGVFQVMGTLAVAVGIGFVVSALMSWLLSQRMGLLNSMKAES